MNIYQETISEVLTQLQSGLIEDKITQKSQRMVADNIVAYLRDKGLIVVLTKFESYFDIYILMYNGNNDPDPKTNAIVRVFMKYDARAIQSHKLKYLPAENIEEVIGTKREWIDFVNYDELFDLIKQEMFLLYLHYTQKEF